MTGPDDRVDAPRPGSPEPTAQEWGIAGPLIVLATGVGAFYLASFGWSRGGWFGLAIGIACIPLVALAVMLSVGLLGAAAVGLCYLFDRDQFNQIVGNVPRPEFIEPAPPAIAPPRRGRLRIGRFLILTVFLALWLSVGLGMVRAAKTRQQKEEAVLIAILVPPGFLANIYAQKWGTKLQERIANRRSGGRNRKKASQKERETD